MIIRVNGRQREVDPPVRLSEVLDLADGAVAPRGMAVAVNGEVVPRGQYATVELTEGATVEIVTAVQGG
jgi:sulfur carrier protein